MIPGSANPLLLATAVAVSTGSRSLRFNSADSAYLSRTPASAGNRKTWTWAGWVKRSGLGSATGGFQNLFSSASAFFGIRFSTSDTLEVFEFSGSYIWTATTTAVFRDPSAWYHIVFAYDTTQATAANRVKLYVNNVQQVFSSPSYPIQNRDGGVNSTVLHSLGCSINGGTPNEYFSGYLADIHFIDGQALDPTSFGEFSATTGVWMPKAFTGSYGTNGFKLDFADNSAATAAALGKDTSGNGNNWTPTNLSVTAGVGNDSLIDVPVNGSQTDTGAGGEVRGNYATWNPLSVTNLYGGALAVLSNGNLDAYAPASSQRGAVSTIELLTKCYSEFVSSKRDASVSYVGIRASSSNALYMWYGTSYYNNGTNEAVGTSYTTGDVVGITYDPSNGELKFYKNGSLAFTKTVSTAVQYVYYVSVYNNETCVANFGQRPFAYTAPSGFNALCTANLPAPTIVKPSTVMDVVLYTGTGSTLTPTSSLGFSPDLVWIKSRSAATDNTLYDAVRGAQARLESNTTDAEVTSDNGLTAFNSAGFTLGTLAQVNTSTATYAAWTWDAGSSTVSNTAGTITSSVRANVSAGFSVFNASIPASASGPTIGHGLGVTPGLVIGKNRNAAIPWRVWHSSFSANQYMDLNSTAAVSTNTNVWGNISSSTIQIGATGTAANVAWVVSGTQDFIFYAFAPVAGYSAFGSYTGNGSADGPFVYTGFRSRWILYKSTTSDTFNHWDILDTSRSIGNAAQRGLQANNANAEFSSSQAAVDILSNGFKLRNNDTPRNQSGVTYVWAAFAESPFQYSRAR